MRTSLKKKRTKEKAMVIHGAYSPKTIIKQSDYIQKRIYKELYRAEPHLSMGDRILVQGLSMHLARIQFMYDELKRLQEADFITAKDRQGNRIDLVQISEKLERLFYINWKNVMRLCEQLALSSKTKAQLGITMDAFKKTDLAKELEHD
ncbi:MAG: hypothetical protein ACFFD4_07715 [Candidatus Odinarchaeota archaeon]